MTTSAQEIDSPRSRPTQRVSFREQTMWYAPSLRQRSTSRTRWWGRIVSADPDTDDENNKDNDNQDDDERSLTVRISQWILLTEPESMSSLMRLIYHLVAFVISLVGVIVLIVAFPFWIAKHLQILYVVGVVAPFITFWMGTRWPETPTIVWSSSDTSWQPDRTDLGLLTAEMFGILQEWRSAEKEVEQMIRTGEMSYQRVSAAHRELLDRFQTIEAGMENGWLVVAGGKESAKELVAAKKLWEEVGDLKQVLEIARETFVDTTSKYNDAHDRFVALESKIEVVEVEIKDVVAKQEGSSNLVGNLIVATATNNENARDRLVALETRVEEVVDEVRDVVGQQGSDESMSALIETLVEEAISKEHTGKADFALHSAGARVMLTLTSPTKEIWPRSMGGLLLGLTTNQGFGIGSRPEQALDPDMHAGKCWPFDGGKGSLGVSLAQRIYVEEITVHHISRRATVHDPSSAPREMEVWGLVDGAENSDKVAKWRQSQVDDDLAESFPFGPEYTRLSTFIYDITIASEAQTFPVEGYIADLQVDFGVVLLMVKSNWGGSYTCLYRLGVHGRRLTLGLDIASPTTTTPYTPDSSLSIERDSA